MVALLAGCAAGWLRRLAGLLGLQHRLTGLLARVAGLAALAGLSALAGYWEIHFHLDLVWPIWGLGLVWAIHLGLVGPWAWAQWVHLTILFMGSHVTILHVDAHLTILFMEFCFTILLWPI